MKGHKVDYTAALASITMRLQKHRQRATYKAVGGIVGLPAQSVGAQLDGKTYQNSWVVAKKTGISTGYRQNELDPNLKGNEIAPSITDVASLQAWLRTHE